VNHPKRNIIRGFVLSFGVAVGLISTAGAAWAQEAPPSTSSGDAGIGDALYVERPAPRPDPANELRADSDPAPASTPAAAPVASAASTPAPAPAPTPAPAAAATPARTVTASAAATSKPARATEVQGVQIVRSAQPAADEGAQLAFTGIDNGPLVVLAGALLALGAVLVRAAQPRRTS
jgi:hypothetical protein